MHYARPGAWSAAVALAVAVVTVAAGMRDGDPAPVRHAAPDPFGFIRAEVAATPQRPAPAAAGADAQLKALFDAHLAGQHAELGRELALRYRAPGAADQAMDLFRRYLAYREALLASGQASLDSLRMLRARFFSRQEGDALLGAGDAHERAAMARFAIGQDRSLDEIQRYERLAAHEASIAPALRETEPDALRLAKAQQAVDALRRRGAGEDQVQRLRALALPAADAARLAAMEQDERAWNGRVAAYLAAPSQQAPEAGFTAGEQARLHAYTHPATPRLSQD